MYHRNVSFNQSLIFFIHFSHWIGLWFHWRIQSIFSKGSCSYITALVQFSSTSLLSMLVQIFLHIIMIRPVFVLFFSLYFFFIDTFPSSFPWRLSNRKDDYHYIINRVSVFRLSQQWRRYWSYLKCIIEQDRSKDIQWMSWQVSVWRLWFFFSVGYIDDGSTG